MAEHDRGRWLGPGGSAAPAHPSAGPGRAAEPGYPGCPCGVKPGDPPARGGTCIIRWSIERSEVVIEPTPVYLSLRDAITRLDPHARGFAPSPELPHVWGSLVEVGFSWGPVTLVAIVDGTTSVYRGDGGATLGTGDLPDIAAAGRRLLQGVEAALGELVPVWQLPVVRPGWVRVLALTYAGMVGLDERMETDVDPTRPLGAVLVVARDILERIARLDAALRPSERARP